MPRTFGYARVSTQAQDLTAQRNALLKAGVKDELVFEEKASGASRKGRAVLARLIALAEAGDTLVVTRIDRLARSLLDLQQIVQELKLKDVAVKATEQPVDTATPFGKVFFDMLGVFAEFETNIRRERQAEGIAIAKQKGVYRGRVATISRDAVRAAAERGDGPTKIARELRISRRQVYRILAERRQSPV